MRLVSAIYGDFAPFDILPGIQQCSVVHYPDDLQAKDILLVWGGQDIHPSLYKKGRSSFSGANREGPSIRDQLEWDLMQRAQELGCPIIGICRGAQMLCAKAGGTLIQHVESHAGRPHPINLVNAGVVMVNSYHHQMMNPAGTKHELIGWSDTLSAVHYDVDENIKMDREPEYVYFPEIKGFAAQWHPEWMAPDTEATKFILQHIKEHL